MKLAIKSSLRIVFILLLTPFSMEGQEIDTKIETLISNEILEKNQVTEFKKLLEKYQEASSEISLHTQILIGLYHLEYMKLTGREPIFSDVYIQYDDDINDSERDIINQQLISYTNKLQASGLLSDKLTKQLHKEIKKNRYVHLLQLKENAVNKAAYADWLATDKLDRYAQQLRDANIISEEAHTELQKDIESGDIQSTIQLLGFFKRGAIIKAPQTDETVLTYLKRIHEDISKILPELAFTKFQCHIEKDKENSFDDYTSYRAMVSFIVNGTTYRHASWVSDENIKNTSHFDAPEFYKIFNKVLVDKKSPLRLHRITGNTDNGLDPMGGVGIAALESHQTEMFRYLGSYLQVSYEPFDHPLTTSEIENAIASYKELGLFDHLQNDQIEKGISEVQLKEIRTTNDIITSFKDVTYSFDYELINLEDPYAEIIREYAKISQGNFNTTEIQDDFSLASETAHLQFKIQGKNYKIPLRVKRDWIDSDFFEKIDFVTKEAKIPGKFYGLQSDEVTTIFLTPEQYQFLKEQQLLLFSNS